MRCGTRRQERSSSWVRARRAAGQAQRARCARIGLCRSKNEKAGAKAHRRSTPENSCPNSTARRAAAVRASRMQRQSRSDKLSRCVRWRTGSARRYPHPTGAMSHPSCSSRQNSRRRPPSDAQGARPGPQRQNATWPWMRMGRMLKPAKQARAIVATAVRILRTLALTHLQGHPLRRLLPCPIAGLPVRPEAEPIRRRMLRPVQNRAQRCGKRAACPPVATVACSPPSGICWLKSADVAKDGTGTAATNSNSDPTSRFEPFLMKPCPHIPFYASPARRHPAAPAASPRASLRGRSSVLRSLLFGCIISPPDCRPSNRA